MLKLIRNLKLNGFLTHRFSGKPNEKHTLILKFSTYPTFLPVCFTKALVHDGTQYHAYHYTITFNPWIGPFLSYAAQMHL